MVQQCAVAFREEKDVVEVLAVLLHEVGREGGKRGRVGEGRKISNTVDKISRVPHKCPWFHSSSHQSYTIYYI